MVQNDECELEDIKHHRELSYCPWCFDEWCSNGVRNGLEFSDIGTPVVDDRQGGLFVFIWHRRVLDSTCIAIICAEWSIASRDSTEKTPKSTS